MAMTTSSNIIVIGAGVLGLSTARVLQHSLSTESRTKITIIAAELPSDPSPSADYASMWAGAHYRPIPGATSQLKDEADLAQRTATTMKYIAADDPEAGVKVMPAREYLENPPEENLLLKTGAVYAGKDDEFRVLDASELPQGVEWGCKYMAWTLNVPVYCSWLLRQFETHGGKVIQRRLSKAEDAFGVAEESSMGKVTVVINCSGRNFDLDPAMKIIRGQTVLVENEYSMTVTRQNKDGSWTFLIPRPLGGGTIVGGSKEIGDVEINARPETTTRLLRQATVAFPDFVKSIDDFVIWKVNVGRRPWREGGLRIETDQIDNDRRIVHGYGAGGRGYELSWGVAERLVDRAMAGIEPEKYREV